MTKSSTPPTKSSAELFNDEYVKANEKIRSGI